MYDLGLYVGWFEILHDFIGLPGLYGLKYDSWMVLLQLASEQGSTINLSYGYLKQRFCFIKLV